MQMWPPPESPGCGQSSPVWFLSCLVWCLGQCLECHKPVPEEHPVPRAEKNLSSVPESAIFVGRVDLPPPPPSASGGQGGAVKQEEAER